MKGLLIYFTAVVILIGIMLSLSLEALFQGQLLKGTLLLITTIVIFIAT